MKVASHTTVVGHQIGRGAIVRMGRVNTFGEPSSMGNLPGGTGGLPLAGVVVPAQIQLMYIPPTIPRINHIPMGHCATNHHIATPLRTALGFKVGTVSRCLVVLILFGLLVDCGLCAQRALFSESLTWVQFCG